ncbi:hypothetical protein [Microbispora amethystogenes]|uniref:Uncharacterized protein n=1 Tax=Microbispora amethystogenes TaxID=1427754 RepID=A0ABQ4FEC6_9ACTN|nr:hypothetical protein [Microbispora amethystogenes]GIH33176.1 hypothetical protein Mam01_33400 [Microbispora amethystogenes]
MWARAYGESSATTRRLAERGDEAAIGKLRAPAEAGDSVAAAEPAESEHAVVERG